MTSWMESLVGPENAALATWIVIALAVIIVALIIFRLVRGMTTGAFISGGRNRKARLAVMDATAIDPRRRLVLIRRDDVEHLILIGGANDLVIEQDIRMIPRSTRGMAAEAEAAASAEPAEVPAVPEPPAPKPGIMTSRPFAGRDATLPPRQAAPARPAPAPPPAPAPKQAPSWRASPPAEPRPATPAAPPKPPAAPQQPAQTRQPAPQPAPVKAAAPAASTSDDLDDELLRELNQSLAGDKQAPAASDDHSLDDEMAKLLGELSRERK